MALFATAWSFSTSHSRFSLRGISLVPPLKRYSIAELDGPVALGGAVIRKGDVLHADVDGVVAVAIDLLSEVERNAAELAEVDAAQERAIRDRVPLPELNKIPALKQAGRVPLNR